MNEKPSILIVSDSNTKPKSIIKLLTKCSSVQEDPADPNKVSCPWKIDTKYYTAEVEVIGITEQYDRTPQFNENVEALMIHMDSNKLTGLEDLVKYTSEDCDPEIKLLLCNYCTNDTKVTKAKAIEWCLQHGFELIELYPDVAAPCEDEECIIKEKVGIERVVEAVQAHIWSNMVKKDMSDSKERNEMCINWCNELLKSNDIQKPEDDFTELFSRLSMVKDSLQSLPVSQRKQCAEQMVTAFWEAIQGDEEELSDD